MSDKKKKKKKKGKVKAKLKNIAKGKISTKMFKGGLRSKVSAPVSTRVSSFTPGTKQEIDKKETGKFNDDILPKKNDKKYLEAFKTAYDKSGGKEFKFDGKRYSGGDKRLGQMVSDMIQELSGSPADKTFPNYTADYVKYVANEVGQPWKMFVDSYRQDPNSHFGKVTLQFLNKFTDPYTKESGKDPNVKSGGNQGGYSSAFKSWVQSKFSKQIGSGTSIDQIMGDQKIQGSYTAETGNKP